MYRRFKVFGIGFAIAAFVAFTLIGAMNDRNLTALDRFELWLAFIAGPIVGTIKGYAEFAHVIALGWLALPLLPAHPSKPAWSTALLTCLGIAIWFYAGFASVAACEYFRALPLW